MADNKLLSYIDKLLAEHGVFDVGCEILAKLKALGWKSPEEVAMVEGYSKVGMVKWDREKVARAFYVSNKWNGGEMHS